MKLKPYFGTITSYVNLQLGNRLQMQGSTVMHFWNEQKHSFVLLCVMGIVCFH